MEMSRPDRPVVRRGRSTRESGAPRGRVFAVRRVAPRELDRPPRLVPNDLIKCTFFPDLRQKQITTPRPDQTPEPPLPHLRALRLFARSSTMRALQESFGPLQQYSGGAN